MTFCLCNLPFTGIPKHCDVFGPGIKMIQIQKPRSKKAINRLKQINREFVITDISFSGPNGRFDKHGKWHDRRGGRPSPSYRFKYEYYHPRDPKRTFTTTFN